MSQHPEGRPHLCLMVSHEVRELIKRQYEKAVRGNAPGDEAAAIAQVWLERVEDPSMVEGGDNGTSDR
jgi:hypothetical protein